MRSVLFLLCLLGTLHCSDIVVVASEHSPLKPMGENEVRQLFLNNRNARAVAVESDAEGLQKRFYDRLAGKNAAQLRAYRAKQIFSGRGNPLRTIAHHAVEAYLQAHPDAVAYIDEAQMSPSLKIIYRLR